MKRLIKKSQYNLQYDVNDIIENFDISKLLLSRNSIYGAYNDCVNYNRWSNTAGPLGVWINEDNQFLLVDGYHRVIKYLFENIQLVNIEVWGIGISDTWKTPSESDKFVIDFSLKWNGLEELSDEETLDDDYEQYFK